jgi:hypothetical protein
MCLLARVAWNMHTWWIPFQPIYFLFPQNIFPLTYTLINGTLWTNTLLSNPIVRPSSLLRSLRPKRRHVQHIPNSISTNSSCIVVNVAPPLNPHQTNPPTPPQQLVVMVVVRVVWCVSIPMIHRDWKCKYWKWGFLFWCVCVVIQWQYWCLVWCLLGVCSCCTFGVSLRVGEVGVSRRLT